MSVTSISHQHGASLIEFMIAMTISLVAIAMITSIYISGLMIDGKNIKLARLRQEVSSITELMIRDIKRAGYVSDAHLNFSGTVDGCNVLATCSHPVFRTVITDLRDNNERADSCMTYAYDEDGSGENNNNNAMGYRLHDGAIEVRVARRACTSGGWTDITDTRFVHISNLKFYIQEPQRSNVCSRAGSALTCKTSLEHRANLSLILSFSTTLVEDSCTLNQIPPDPDCVTLTVNKNVRLRNAIYN